MGLREIIKAEQEDVDNWNAKHPVGTEVRVMRDFGGPVFTKTRSEAWMLGGHTAVIMLEDISGAYSLDRCKPQGSNHVA